GGGGRGRTAGAPRRGLLLVQAAVVDARRGARYALAPRNGDRLHRHSGRRWRPHRPAVLRDGQDSLPVDAHRDVLAVDDEPLENRVLLRGLQALEHLREALFSDDIRGDVRALARAL